jgi:hypothetical protein
MMRATFTSTFDMEGFKRNIKSGVVDVAKKRFRDVVRGNSSDNGITNHFLGLVEKACKDDPDELKRFSDHIRGTKRDPKTEKELLEFIETIDYPVNLDHERDIDKIGGRMNFKRAY